MKPFLILQLRPEKVVSDDEYAAILAKSGLEAEQTQRVCLDREDLPADLDLSAFSGVIVGGGPGCVSDPPEEKTPTEAKIEAAILSLMPEVTARDVPFMGCCYGIGVLGHHLGVEVSKRRYAEAVGAVPCRVTEAGRDDPVLSGLPDVVTAFVGHKEALQDLPSGAVHLMEGDVCPYQMIRVGQNIYATQFHPEADPDGLAVRVRAYKDKGYFPPEEADALIARNRDVDTSGAARILRNFVDNYRRD